MRLFVTTLIYILSKPPTSPSQQPILDYHKCTTCLYYNEMRGRCSKFGDQNRILEDVRYIYAKDARDNQELCGKNATFYIQSTSVPPLSSSLAT